MADLDAVHVEVNVFASVRGSDPAFLLGGIEGFDGSTSHGSGARLG